MLKRIEKQRKYAGSQKRWNTVTKNAEKKKEHKMTETQKDMKIETQEFNNTKSHE